MQRNIGLRYALTIPFARAVGITFGLDVIYSALEAKGVVDIDTSPVQLYVIPMGTEIESLNIVTRLRRH